MPKWKEMKAHKAKITENEGPKSQNERKWRPTRPEELYCLGRQLCWRILILVPTTRNPGTSLFTMGKEYKMFLGVPGSFFLHGWQWFFCSWAVPGGLWGHQSGMSMVHLTLFSNLTVPSLYIHAPNLIAGFHVKLAPRILVWIPLPHAQSWSRHCAKTMLPCMSRRVAPTLNATGPKKEASFCKKACLASMDPLCVCVYACTRGSCVDSIWLWVRKETFSKPVFGVSKTSISGFVAVGPHCIYIYICVRFLILLPLMGT